METLTYRITLRLVKMLNVALMAIPLMICWNNVYSKEMGIVDTQIVNGLILVVFLIAYMTYGRIYDCFFISLVRISEMVYSQCLALIMADIWIYILLVLIEQRFAKIIPMLIVFVVQMFFSICWCTIAHIWYFKKFSAKKTAIIYDTEQSVAELINAYGLRKKFDVQVIASVEACIYEKFKVLNGMDAVFMCGIHSHERNMLLKYCVDKNIIVYVLPRIGDTIMSGAKRMHLFHLPFLRVGRYEPTPEYLFLKRVFDIVVSALALVILSPIMLFTAIGIKVTDGGSVFYKQKRLTKNGKEFNVLKFRSMRQDAEKDGVARLSTGENDDRITPIGKIIRKVRIDELPQLINILEGSMSIVGPRPERPEIAQQYEKELPEFSLRLQAKAGLTGYAQVYGKYNTTPYDKLQMDLMYIAHPSFWEDLRIIFATIKILFIPESTEGVSVGMETAMKKTEEEKKEIEV